MHGFLGYEAVKSGRDVPVFEMNTRDMCKAGYLLKWGGGKKLTQKKGRVIAKLHPLLCHL
jgi:hypothetical protein